MKAWISICTIISVAGMVTVLAQETKTNTPAGATNAPITNEVAAQPPVATPAPAPAPAVAKEVKPPAVAPPKPAKAVVPVPMTLTSAPAPAAVPLMETSAVPAQPEITAEPQTPTNAAAPPDESFRIGRKSIWLKGVAALVVVIGLAIFLWQRFHAASRGSLITSAMAEDQKSREDKNAPPPMT